jgi:MerR family transcriptional regulator, light-induced transcriptional regulator
VTDDPVPRLPPVDPTSAATVPASSLSPELLAGLLADGDDELAGWTLQHALAEQPRAEVYDGLLNAAMTLVGERWETGRWTVADEHLATQTLLSALERVRPRRGPEQRVGPLAVLAALAGERHAVGLVCLEHVLQEAGWVVANLGPDVPAGDLATFIERNEARLVALTASDADRLPVLGETVTSIRGVAPDVPIILGGRLAVRPGIGEAFDLHWTGTSLTGALRYAASLQAGDSAPPAVERPVS